MSAGPVFLWDSFFSVPPPTIVLSPDFDPGSWDATPDSGPILDLGAEYLRRCAEHHRNAPDPIMEAVMVDLAFDLFLTRIPAMPDYTPKAEQGACPCDYCAQARAAAAVPADRFAAPAFARAENYQSIGPAFAGEPGNVDASNPRDPDDWPTAAQVLAGTTRDGPVFDKVFRGNSFGVKLYDPTPPAHEYFVLLQTEQGARAWSAMTREEADRMAHALNAETGLYWRVVSTHD